jgi:hypothetical protein
VVGVWVLAAIGLYLVVTDALERRRLGVTFWPMDAVRQGLASFVLLVPVAFVVYLGSWAGWLFSDGGYDRKVAEISPATGFFSWVPLPLQSLWKYHETIYASMAGMTSPHSYSSAAWAWPFLWRPTSMYAFSSPDGRTAAAATTAACRCCTACRTPCCGTPRSSPRCTWSTASPSLAIGATRWCWSASQPPGCRG